jgi:alanine racemase
MMDARAWAEIDLEAVRHNVASIRALIGAARSVMAVVKADAYGHGGVAVAGAALEAGAACLGVATVAEGAALRAAGHREPIFLLSGPAPVEIEALVANRLIPLVGDFEMLEALASTPGFNTIEVHLDIDTGMGRSGIAPNDAVRLYLAAIAKGLTVTGISTHFADADGESDSHALGQLARFRSAMAALQQVGAHFEWIHIANSAVTVRFPDAPGNLVRPGLLLYGIQPPVPDREAFPSLRPVMSLKARVASVRELPAGATISYGATFRLSRPSRVATVLIGYGDGYPRALSNRGAMLLGGRRAPILGRICMDQTVVDVTDIPGVRPGDIAVCIGADGGERISVEEIARLVDTTEHLIPTVITARVPRILV